MSRITKSTTLDQLDSWRSTGATILGIKNAHNKYTMNPGYHERLEAGDKIMAMGDKEQIDALRKLVA